MCVTPLGFYLRTIENEKLLNLEKATSSNLSVFLLIYIFIGLPCDPGLAFSPLTGSCEWPDTLVETGCNPELVTGEVGRHLSKLDYEFLGSNIFVKLCKKRLKKTWQFFS